MKFIFSANKTRLKTRLDTGSSPPRGNNTPGGINMATRCFRYAVSTAVQSNSTPVRIATMPCAAGAAYVLVPDHTPPNIQRTPVMPHKGTRGGGYLHGVCGSVGSCRRQRDAAHLPLMFEATDTMDHSKSEARMPDKLCTASPLSSAVTRAKAARLPTIHRGEQNKTKNDSNAPST